MRGRVFLVGHGLLYREFIKSKYENVLILSDFNSEISEDAMQLFSTTYDLKSVVKQPTCFKNVDYPCVDLILTNKSLYFQNTSIIDTLLSDFHCLTITTMKSNLEKQIKCDII